MYVTPVLNVYKQKTTLLGRLDDIDGIPPITE